MSIPPVGITAGPDGAIWFTGGTIVGRISTTGAVTQFPVPFIAYGITTGSDGALWLAGVTPTPPERAPPVTVARLTTTGALTIYLAPALGDGLGITTGRDGALWFAENAPDKIGRITTTGKIAEFPLPTPFAFPVAIVNGPDGALWFTEQLAGKIGRITTSGTITEFRLPSAGSNPEGITAGPDGALWFTEDAGRIGRITTAGAITELPVPTASGIPTGSRRDLTGRSGLRSRSATASAALRWCQPARRSASTADGGPSATCSRTSAPVSGSWRAILEPALTYPATRSHPIARPRASP